MPRVVALMVLMVMVAACSPDAGSGSTATIASGDGTTSTTAASTATTAATPTTTTIHTPTTTATTADVVIEGGTDEVPDLTVTGTATFSVGVGDTVHISVLSSVDDEIHVHGYDLHYDAVAGEVTVVEFVADAPGIFEAELEEHGKLLFELEVGG